MKKTVLAIAATGSVLLCALTGCSAPSAGTTTGGSGSHASRVQFYDSIPDLADDSTAVVVATVGDQHEANDITEDTDFTLSDVTVVEAPKPDEATQPGATITVRQFGSKEQPPVATLLEPGRTYLLYLTATGLDGELGSQYYVTGSSAGLYESDESSVSRRAAASDTATFTKVPALEAEAEPDGEADSLPNQVVLSDAID